MKKTLITCLGILSASPIVAADNIKIKKVPDNGGMYLVLAKSTPEETLEEMFSEEGSFLREFSNYANIDECTTLYTAKDPQGNIYDFNLLYTAKNESDSFGMVMLMEREPLERVMRRRSIPESGLVTMTYNCPEESSQLDVPDAQYSSSNN